MRSDDAALVARILVTSDVRGIESHGVARLREFYVEPLRAGRMEARAKPEIVRETATSILVDAHNGLGHPAGDFAMRRVLEKAAASGVAFGAVRRSNHFGIAGYYAMLALERDMIGICSTNTPRFAPPTNGRVPMLGTNPLAFAVPAGDETPFVLDFATTTVPRGKLEVHARKHLPLLPGWAVDLEGRPTIEPVAGLAGGLLPLGGFGTDNGGHKGYGLGLLVDILCGVLAGGTFGAALPLPDEAISASVTSHFFGALRIDAFRDVAAFKLDMDRELRAFKQSARVPGAPRVYVAGEIEAERTLRNLVQGIPLDVVVWEDLRRLADELGVDFDLDEAGFAIR